MIEGGEAVTPQYIKEGKWEIEVAGTNYPAEISIRPMFDPENKKIKC